MISIDIHLYISFLVPSCHHIFTSKQEPLAGGPPPGFSVCGVNLQVQQNFPCRYISDSDALRHSMAQRAADGTPPWDFGSGILFKRIGIESYVIIFVQFGCSKKTNFTQAFRTESNDNRNMASDRCCISHLIWFYIIMFLLEFSFKRELPINRTICQK